jgi:hypothetical protein
MFIGIRLFVEDLKTIFSSGENRLRGHLGGKTDKTASIIRVVAQLGISIVILVICFPIVFAESQSEQAKKYAAGFIGTVIGFWLR